MSHYYDKDGNDAYTQPNKSKPGETRKTTVADCRKLGLVPSVTTILQMEAKPAIVRWNENNIMSAVWENPRFKKEDEKTYKARIVGIVKKNQEEVMAEGTRIHNLLEKYYLKKLGNIEKRQKEDDIKIIRSTDAAIEEHFGKQEWNAEESFATNKFGGKVDLSTKGIVVDFKTKNTDDKKFMKYKPYPAELMQLAAYRKGLKMPKARCANVYISVQSPGLVRIIEHTEAEMWRNWMMFLDYVNIWRNVNKFDDYSLLPF